MPVIERSGEPERARDTNGVTLTTGRSLPLIQEPCLVWPSQTMPCLTRPSQRHTLPSLA